MKTKLKIKFNIKNINGYKLNSTKDMSYPYGDRINLWFGMIRLETQKGWVDIYENNSLNTQYSISDLEQDEGLSINYIIDNVVYKDFVTRDDKAYDEESPFSIKYLLSSDEIGSHIFEGNIPMMDIQVSQDSFDNYRNKRVLDYLFNDVEIKIGIESIELIEDSTNSSIWIKSDKYQEPEKIDAFEE